MTVHLLQMIPLPYRFTADNFTQLAGYQYTMKYDPTVLEVLEATENELPDFWIFFGDINHDAGMLTTVGQNQLALFDFADALPEEKLLSIKVRAKSTGLLSEVLDFTSDFTPKAAYDSSQIKRNVVLAFDEVVRTMQPKDKYLPQIHVFPNPVTTNTSIYYKIHTKGRVMVSIKDAIGRTITTVKDCWENMGNYTVPLFNKETLSPGVLFCGIKNR